MSFKFSSLSSFARDIVLRYKQQRVKDVVETYAHAVDAMCVVGVPKAVDAYRKAAHVIVDKTFANPIVAVNLLDAIDAAVKYYGPDLKVVVDEYVTEYSAALDQQFVTSRLERLNTALKALKTDTN